MKWFHIAEANKDRISPNDFYLKNDDGNFLI